MHRYRFKLKVKATKKVETNPFMIGSKYEKQLNFLASRVGYLPGLDKEDLVSLAKLKIAKEIHKFNPECGTSEKTWIIEIIKRYYISIRRSALSGLRINKDSEGKPLYDFSLDDECADLIQANIITEEPTQEEELIFKDLLKEVKRRLDPFEQLVFMCRVEPHDVYDGPNNTGITLTQRANHEYKQLEYACCKNKTYVSRKHVYISNTTICRHLTALLSSIPDENGELTKEVITRGQIDIAMRNVKLAVKQVIEDT